MKVNPTSFEGSLIYTDTAKGVTSTDFNTYLYYTIQAAGMTIPVTQWGKSVTGTDILEAQFIPNGTTNNVIKYTTSADYSTKSLSEF